MKKLICICCLCIGIAFPTFTQQIWTNISEPEAQLSSTAERQIIPLRYLLTRLDQQAFKTALQEVRPLADGHTVRIAFPMPNGQFEYFEIFRSKVLSAGLASKFPEIQTYAGRSIHHPQMQLFFDHTPQGVHAMIRSIGESTIFIDPVAKGITDTYISYYKKDYQPANRSVFECLLDHPTEDQALVNTGRAAGDCELRTYRLALACTGEYAQFHGGNVPDVLAAMVTAMVRVNGVFEVDFGITMELVPNTDTLIFLNPTTDPFTNNSGGTMLGENQNIVDERIGNDNYDIGHVFSTGGGGIAGAIGNICRSGQKAEGVTGQPQPINDPFTIDYVAHEMGHQYGGNHTQNNPCNRVGIASMEPGSASTIMGYAGICFPNVQSNSDPYFHAISIQEIIRYTQQNAGNTCPVKTDTGNNPPTIEEGTDYQLPISTPFVLTAVANDPDDNVLTYCWEQMDPEEGTMPPVSTSIRGPMFRSILPDTLPSRFFPNLSDLVDNIDPQWEELPSVSRNMKFRCTVRDNNFGNGCTDETDVVLSFHDSAGPFLVAYPNTTETFQIGEFVEVRWDVADTDQSPVNCQAVNILLSTDGGYKYPITLAEGIPNSGSFFINMPNIITDLARIQVQAADNIFFDISDQNFSIVAPIEPGYSLGTTPYRQLVCLPQAAQVELLTAPFLGYDSLITFTVEGLPAGAIAEFSNNPILPGETTNLNILMDNVTAIGTYMLEIVATAPETDTARREVILDLVSTDFSTLATETPTNGAVGLSEVPLFSWHGSPTASSYAIEVATLPTFDTAIVHTASALLDTFWSPPQQLERNRPYYWRVRAFNECGFSDFTPIRTFHTETLSCNAYDYIDGNTNIPASGVDTIRSIIEIPAGGAISDLNVDDLKMQHDLIKHLKAEVVSPQGKAVTLFEDLCGNTQLLDISLDDDAPSAIPCPPIGGQIHLPQGELSAFNGESSIGEWQLRLIIIDTDGQGGTFQNWGLEICSNISLSGPFIVNNNLLEVKPNQGNPITSPFLMADDADNTAEELTFTVVEIPQHGTLYKLGNALEVGSKFTQLTINAGNLRYENDINSTADIDQFGFTVNDGEGGWIGGQVFNISIDESATTAVKDIQSPNTLFLYPNPAQNSLYLQLRNALSSRASIRLFNVQGQQLLETILPAHRQQHQLAVEQLVNGAYFLQIQNHESILIQKFTIHR